MRKQSTVILLTGTSVHGRRKSESIASSIQSTKKTSCSTYKGRKERTSRKKQFKNITLFRRQWREMKLPKNIVKA